LKICSVVDPALGIEYIMGIYPWVQTVGTWSRVYPPTDAKVKNEWSCVCVLHAAMQ
jgi:hypothetical protein